MGSGNGLLEVRIAAPAADAPRIARLLVEERLAACTQVLPGMTSTFRWDGEVTTADEDLVLAKTHRSRFDAILERVGEVHPYETPEIIAVPIVEASAAYAAWLVAEVSQGGGS
ncbi:cytochrome C biogenesis protein CcdA [Knoellia sinensis KCTC 19936]|uniref:Cytochrome C biogenesis protein CcdA n=1 Tax=Knoellia sinensis KCTC 19936 TaxID=1385520 RepID=A0A0A0J6F8_9MICO|nr:cytochrome C biogenesis protein CcdA [Knoellia sinensis KCTC 19936]